MKITQERIENIIKAEDGGSALMIVCINKRFIYAMMGKGDVVKQNIQQAMIEDEKFAKIICDAWDLYQKIKIISN